ncbi:DUF309 domain-containing protein [Paenibacillus solisilvae]|uniref:DUF309 domain-containing protein n=1 Tax=Paenibacillus solisilvae TaxID=2486751 RepID=A0ABW0VRJ3_9BACL
MPNNEYPSAYLSYLVEFHATRDYFECHELLEEYWKEHPGDGLGRIWVGLIQLAVGSYHQRRGNIPGALKMLRQSKNKITDAEASQIGVNGVKLREMLMSRLDDIERGEPFTDMEIPLEDEALLQQCKQLCSMRGLIWNAPSSGEAALVHRHTLRDRSDVVAARAAAVIAREEKKRL